MGTLFGASIFFSAFQQSDFFGRLIFLGLFALSAICWSVLIYKIWLTKNVKRICHAFQHAVSRHKERILELELHTLPKPRRKEIPHPFAHILGEIAAKTLEVLNKNLYFQEGNGRAFLTEPDLNLIGSQGLIAISKQKKLLEKSLFVLATTVTLAPFLGLLGTVWGILLTFTHLQSGATFSSNNLILGGLSTALATTVIGLVIAIPALIAHNYLKNAIRVLSSDMEDFLASLLSTLEMQYRKVE